MNKQLSQSALIYHDLDACLSVCCVLKCQKFFITKLLHPKRCWMSVYKRVCQREEQGEFWVCPWASECVHTTPPCLPLHGVWVFSCLHSFLWESHLARCEDQHTAQVLVAPAATATKSALILPGLWRQTPRLPLAHCSAMLLGSSFVTLH